MVVTESTNLNSVILRQLETPEHAKLKQFHPGVEFIMQLEPDILNIIGSPVHLAKTVMNLLSNAAEAMPSGGKVAITTQNQYLDRTINGYEQIDFFNLLS